MTSEPITLLLIEPIIHMHRELSLPTLERASVPQTDEGGLTALDWPSLTEIDASDAYDR
jgi:hypothetical protein